MRDAENARQMRVLTWLRWRLLSGAVIVRYGASEIGEVVGGLYGLRADDRLLGYGQPRAEGLQHSL